ncbi:MAG: T9SS type A sorting domain-containing protein, partial [Candidatus Latescibacterota bacterium]
GDEVAGDKIYSNTFVFHAYSRRHIEYVYVINFVSNTSHISENLEGDNHIINIEQNLLSAKVSNVYGYMGITAAIPFFIDNDKDGIADNIDTQPGAFSNDFSNIAVGGTTTGTIIDRGGRTWKLYKEPNSNGIHIIAGTGTFPATVVGTCSPIVTNEILANTPAEYVLTSGSATLNVITGRIITRIAEGDLRMSAEIGAGNAITFSTEENGIIIATASSSTTNILLTVNGETFTLEAGQTSVCQRTPKGTMRNVLTDITELRGSVTDNKDLNKLDEVIEYVTASINSEFWKDDVHLLTKHGEEVFNKGKDAVNILRNLVKDDKSTITDALLNDFIDRIVASEHELAQIAVKDVTEAGGDMKKISKANEEISKGNSDVSEGKFDSGIEHYRNAWTHALSAVPNLKNADQSLLKFGVAEENIIPTEFKLFGNYPNPFNPTTTIRYSVPEKAVVRLTIYNQLGQRIANLVNEEKEAGYHTVEWNAGNIASGLYFYELNTEKFRSVKKLLLMK